MKQRFFSLAVLLLLGVAFFPAKSGAQTTNLSGVINIYAPVTAVDVPNNAVTVASAAGFAIGDTVIIMQMQGATIDQSNSASFGNITAIGNAGNYEFAVVCDIVGNVITFDQQLSRTYSNNATDGVQLISFPNYGPVLVTAPLTAQPWNGLTGGVLAFKSSGTVTLAANITLVGCGFPGGGPSVNGGGCGVFPNFFLAAPSIDGGYKGNGIADISVGKEQGKGKQANGGGGGNGHNCGGGGGSNYAAGGNGGDKSSGCGALVPSNPGIGGLSLSAEYTSNKIFLGGGGGGGQQNNAEGTSGAAGAGIAIIQAPTFSGSGFSILASAVKPPMIGTGEDAGGGGGGGGTILLNVGAFTSPLNVDVRGGDGGNTATVATRRLGPGGGGGGGILWLSGGSLDPFITLQNAGGLAGTAAFCTCPSGATNGSPGGFRTGLTFPTSLVNYAGCDLTPLPVEYAYFTATPGPQNSVKLDWKTTSEINNDRFVIEHSTNGISFDPIGETPSTASNGEGAEYVYFDRTPVVGDNWYRIRQYDRDGRTSASEIRHVHFEPTAAAIVSLHPNPVNAPGEAVLEVMLPGNGAGSLSLINVLGQIIARTPLAMDQGLNTVKIPTASLVPGIYFVKLNAGTQGEVVAKLKVN